MAKIVQWCFDLEQIAAFREEELLVRLEGSALRLSAIILNALVTALIINIAM